MKINDEKYRTAFCILKRSYQLRTGQMRLPVRAVKPVQLQYKAPVAEVITELPQAPGIGKFYVYKGRKVQCVASDNCDECIRPCDEIYCSSLFSFDKVSIKVIPAN